MSGLYIVYILILLHIYTYININVFAATVLASVALAAGLVPTTCLSGELSVLLSLFIFSSPDRYPSTCDFDLYYCFILICTRLFSHSLNLHFSFYCLCLVVIFCFILLIFRLYLSKKTDFCLTFLPALWP